LSTRNAGNRVGVKPVRVQPSKESEMADSSDGGGPWTAAPTRTPNDQSSHRPEGSAFNFSTGQDNESIPELLRELVQQGGHLAEQQTKLVQAEVRSAVGDLTGAVGAMAGAAVVAIAGSASC
jgi:hypothetical protein